MYSDKEASKQKNILKSCDTFEFVTNQFHFLDTHSTLTQFESQATVLKSQQYKINR